MKLLYLIPSFQHPQVRGPNRHYHLVRELSDQHDITLLVLNRSEVSPAAMEEVRSYVEQLHIVDVEGDAEGGSMESFALRLPFVGRRVQRSLRFRSAVQRMAAIFNRLHSEHSYDAVVFHGKSIFPVIQGFQKLPIVVDFCDATSMRIRNEMRYARWTRRMWLWTRFAEVRRIEQGLLRATPHVAFIAPRDRDAVLGPGSGAQILPNGVDHDFWKRKASLSDRNCIVFSGVMSYGPNHDAAMYLIDRIAPRIRQHVPDLNVVIVGRDPAPELRDKGKQIPGVTVTGFVEDVREYLERAEVFAAPLRYASGTQNKVLEAMSMSLPTVVTSIVADGLRVDDAQVPPVGVADQEAEFAAAIVRLLQNPSERNALALRGREYVENHFIWSRSADKLDRMCRAAVGTETLTQNQLIGAFP